MNHDDRFYTQFLYKTNSIDNYAEIEKIISASGTSKNVTVADLSNMKKHERTAELNSIIASERMRLYYPGDPEYILSIYKTDESEFFFILSVCGLYLKSNSEDVSLICKNIFNCLPEDCSTPIPSSNVSNKYTINYWSDLFENLNSDNFKGIKRGNSELNMVSFRADNKLEDAFSRFVERGGSGSALCATVLGQMASHLLDSRQVIVNQILTGTPLSCAPIILNYASDYGTGLHEVISQLKSISSHCFCKRTDLYQAIGNRFINRVMITSGYSDPTMYSNILNYMETGVCYVQPGIDTLDSPLCVFTRRFDNEMSIIYYYDEKAFESVDMAKLHGEICKLFEKSLNISDNSVGSINVENITASNSSAGNTALSKAAQIRFNTIKSLPPFSKYSDEEILSLLEDVTFVLRNPRQYILNHGGKMDRVYFVCVGRVQVLGKDSKGIINPLFIAKPGDVFGVESLTQNHELRNTYKAFYEDVVLMSISRDVLIHESHRHPEILQYILGKQMDISTRFQNLWLTV